MELNKVAIYGAGTMGSGIAQWMAQQSIQTEITDASPEVLQVSRAKIHQSWDKLQTKGKFSSEEVETFKQGISFLPPEHVSTDNNLLIEAIIENLAIKTELFERLDKTMSEHTVFASNTSSFSIAALAKGLSPERRRNFIGLHFFNPATLMKLVEIISSPWTNSSLADGLEKWFSQKGKKPAQCQDGPGFIVNRVARNFYGEALRIAGKEDQSKFSEIDRALKKCGGFRMGPFELMDLIGIDVNLDVTTSVWNQTFQEVRFAPHPLQKAMVDSGRLGLKTKRGFYEYE